ncbi:MAG: hypothetical protein C0469_13180 [Cyanobacteria bacterium DS2.3.42]|nr:hypothetical protein [Cyanobacteria bacterium DS2.3.42]
MPDVTGWRFCEPQKLQATSIILRRVFDLLGASSRKEGVLRDLFSYALACAPCALSGTRMTAYYRTGDPPQRGKLGCSPVSEERLKT